MCKVEIREVKKSIKVAFANLEWALFKEWCLCKKLKPYNANSLKLYLSERSDCCEN